MRINCVVTLVNSVIIVFLGITLILNTFAIINDIQWNKIKSGERGKFTKKAFDKCNVYPLNASTNFTYETVLKADFRNLPYEFLSLILTGSSFISTCVIFLLYVFVATADVGIWMSIAWHGIGFIAQTAATVLLFLSSLIYSDPALNYQGSKACYTFTCADCPPGINDYAKTRIESYYLEARECFENLHVCQLAGLKNRGIFLLAGTALGSLSIIYSSIRRIKRLKRVQVIPKPWISSTKSGPDEELDLSALLMESDTDMNKNVSR